MGGVLLLTRIKEWRHSHSEHSVHNWREVAPYVSICISTLLVATYVLVCCDTRELEAVRLNVKCQIEIVE